MPLLEWSRGRVKRVFGMLVSRNRGEVGSAIWSEKVAGGLNGSVCSGSQCLAVGFEPWVKVMSVEGQGLGKERRGERNGL